MGRIRNGARSALKLLADCCKLSRLPGFRGGVAQILGTSTANDFFALWDPLCSFIDVLIGADNWFNQIDSVDDDSTGEDGTVL